MVGSRRWRGSKVSCLAGATLLAGLASGCGDASGPTVFAASSLTEVTPLLVDDPDAVFVFGGSNHLIAQVADGATPDLLLVAHPGLGADWILEASGLVAGEHFAENRLVVATPAGNPASVRSLADLERSELTLAVCAIEVPCGEATLQLARKFDLEPSVDTFEPSARAVVQRLALGEADLGVVYFSDVANDSRLEPVWPKTPASSTSPSVVYVTIPFTATGRALAEDLHRPAAQQILSDHGFDAPPETGR